MARDPPLAIPAPMEARAQQIGTTLVAVAKAKRPKEKLVSSIAQLIASKEMKGTSREAMTIHIIRPWDRGRAINFYDFGDDWVHLIEATSTGDPKSGNIYLRLAEITGRCPPEDVGGLPGYEHFLRVIGDPKHPEHEELLEWVGEQFDPHVPDADDLHFQVLRLAKKWKPRCM